MKKLIIAFLFIAASTAVTAQSQKHTDTALFNAIYKVDSAWFAAFNNKDLATFITFISKDLEFYHDGSGLTNYEQNIAAFKNNGFAIPDLKRTLLKETMEVYPVPGFGAVQIAEHRFCHMENGKMDCGVFKFIHVWKQTPEGWKVTRIISVDH